MPAGFHRAGCCCQALCGGCENAEPDATVTMNAEACDDLEFCDVYDGNYTFSSTAHDVDEDYCWWVLEHPTISAIKMNLLYCNGTGVWYARIGRDYTGDVSTPLCNGGYDPSTATYWKEVTITCTAGVLSGSFTLDGKDRGTIDCVGCSVDVTLT